MAKCWGYGRVSTDRQENSADAQGERLTAYAERSGLEVGGVYVDSDVSAAKVPLNRRPQGKLLWDQLDRGDVVVCTKLDRCFRSMADAAATMAVWKSLGVEVRFLDLGIDVSTPAGELFFNQLAAFAQYESQIIGQRQREINAYLKQQGRPRGNARPFGWVRHKDAFVHCAEERETGALVLRMRGEGASFPAVATYLARRHKKPVKTGKSQGYYSLCDVWMLHRAASAGYPMIPPRSPQADWIGVPLAAGGSDVPGPAPVT